MNLFLRKVLWASVSLILGSIIVPDNCISPRIVYAQNGQDIPLFEIDRTLKESQISDDALRPQIEEACRLLKAKQWDAVIELLEKTKWLQENATVYGILGNAYYAKSTIRTERDTPLRAIHRYIFNQRAINYFQKAIGLNPENPAWSYGLATVYIAKNDKESLHKAADLLLKVQAIDQNYLNTMPLLGFVYRRLNETDKSQVTLQEFLKSRPDPVAMLELAWTHVDKNEMKEAEHYYTEALKNLNDEKALKRVVDDLGFLLSGRDKSLLEQTPDKGKWIVRYWMERDPTPRTPENERIQEHLQRVAYACKNYNSPGARSRYDDRGKIYIKFGPPSYRYQDSGNSKVYQNESWTYDWKIGTNKDGLIFDFANEAGYGFRLITDLRNAFMTTWNTMDLVQLYQDREDINSAYYAPIAHSFDLIDFTEKFRTMQIKKLSAIRNAPEQVFQYEGFPEKRLPVFLENATFRGENSTTRHEIYYGFPLHDINFQLQGDKYQNSLVREVTVRNARTEELFHQEGILDLSFSRTEKVSEKTYIGQVNFEILPQDDIPLLHFSISDPGDKRMGLYYFNLQERNYTGKDLTVSDLKFSYHITPSREPDDFTHKGLRIVPLPTSTLDKHRPVFIYFEVYNLSVGSDDKSDCHLQYTVEKDVSFPDNELVFYDVWGNKIQPAASRLQKEYISLSSEITMKGPDHAEYTSIDLGGLENGSYTFIVSVTDLNSQQTARSSRHFVLF